jgi:hypothetical protein
VSKSTFFSGHADSWRLVWEWRLQRHGRLGGKEIGDAVVERDRVFDVGAWCWAARLVRFTGSHASMSVVRLYGLGNLVFGGEMAWHQLGGDIFTGIPKAPTGHEMTTQSHNMGDGMSTDNETIWPNLA